MPAYPSGVYALLQESGLARVLLEEIGLETVMKVNRPAQSGDRFTVSVGYVDVPKGIFKLEEDLSGSADMLPEDEDNESDDAASSDVSAQTTYS